MAQQSGKGVNPGKPRVSVALFTFCLDLVIMVYSVLYLQHNMF